MKTIILIVFLAASFSSNANRVDDVMLQIEQERIADQQLDVQKKQLKALVDANAIATLNAEREQKYRDDVEYKRATGYYRFNH